MGILQFLFVVFWLLVLLIAFVVLVLPPSTLFGG